MFCTVRVMAARSLDLPGIALQGKPVACHCVRTSIASNMGFGGDVCFKVVASALVVGVLWVVQMAGDPVALEETSWHEVDMVLDGLPKVAVNVVISISQHGIEDNG